MEDFQICQDLIISAQRYLDRARRLDLSSGLHEVLNRLSSIITQLEQSDEEILSLRQRVDSERQARIKVQQREQGLLERIKARDDEIKEQAASIRKLEDNVQAAKEKYYDKGFKDGVEAERNQQKQPDSDFEELIRRQLDRGNDMFTNKDFHGASILLQQADDNIKFLPTTRWQLFDMAKLRYQIAICGAYVKDLTACKESLTSFIQFATFNTREEMLHLAHAQHLLAQVYIGQNRLQDAQIASRRASDLRRQAKLPPTDNLRYQSIALSARVVELLGQGDASILRDAIYDSSARQSLKEAYSRLKPLQSGNNAKNESYILTDPASELLPIWTMKIKSKQPDAIPNNSSTNKGGNTKGPTTKPPHPPTLDPLKRGEWLNSLKLTNPTNERLDPSLDQAIRSGDVQKVSQILITSRPRPVAPALHMAALFNEADIAKLLIQHGASVFEICEAESETHKPIHGVLPMHCAIGAQNDEMIRLLKDKGADFKATTTPVNKRHRVSAPPLWLISDRWLRTTGKDDAASVLRILATMKELGWSKRDKLNEDGDRMAELVEKLKTSRPQLRRAVLEFLERN